MFCVALELRESDGMLPVRYAVHVFWIQGTQASGFDPYIAAAAFRGEVLTRPVGVPRHTACSLTLVLTMCRIRGMFSYDVAVFKQYIAESVYIHVFDIVFSQLEQFC